MSTSETFSQAVCKCPCGYGNVTRHVTTQDNPWSSSDISIELDCIPCSATWSLEGHMLVLRSSKLPYEDAKSAEYKIHEQLRDAVATLTDEYFTRFDAKTKKAEWEEMKRLDIYSGSYRSFLALKGRGMRAGQIAYGLRNEEWLQSLAGGSLDRQIEDLAVAKSASAAAYSQIVRRRIESDGLGTTAIVK